MKKQKKGGVKFEVRKLLKKFRKDVLEREGICDVGWEKLHKKGRI